MSSVSSLGSTQVDLFNLLQQTGGNGQAQGSTPGASGTTQDSQDPTGSQTSGVSSGHHHHHGSGRFSQIQSAVTSALQSAAPGSDPNQVIQNAIATALKQGSTGQSGTPGTTPGAATTDPSAAATGTSTTPAPADSQNAFESLLASYGVNAQQFSQDFKAAIQQSGIAFPAGSQTDVVG